MFSCHRPARVTCVRTCFLILLCWPNVALMPSFCDSVNSATHPSGGNDCGRGTHRSAAVKGFSAVGLDTVAARSSLRSTRGGLRPLNDLRAHGTLCFQDVRDSAMHPGGRTSASDKPRKAPEKTDTHQGHVWSSNSAPRLSCPLIMTDSSVGRLAVGPSRQGPPPQRAERAPLPSAWLYVESPEVHLPLPSICLVAPWKTSKICPEAINSLWHERTYTHMRVHVRK